MRALVAFLVVVTSGLVSGSAIPMWEFLSRGEKMSHLFNMFVKQVEDHCDQSTMPDCNKVLMVYGLTNLAKMDDDSLDKMDPYQREAHDIIWDSMMKGSYKNAGASTTPGSSSTSSNTTPSRRNEGHDVYAGDDDGDLADGGNGLGGAGDSRDQDDVARYAFGHGPMVVRVMPDGSPVPGDVERPLPRDEDAEEFRLMRGQPMPSLEEIQRPRAPGAAPGAQHSQHSQHRPRGHAPDRFQAGPAPQQGHYSSRFPQLTASQPHAKFALPPPGMNFRIAARPHQP
ncbi:rhythmically expressed gene 5 protein [Thrips palmi]|uniref:Rhythmically expressed gene 5 protein n=1 Tax=Thrips palmi TaxID=161013 RepID=A0A6P9AHN7_THRPL|nr:rhythmically expressed gene 5 protein [Thrips palmi]